MADDSAFVAFKEQTVKKSDVEFCSMEGYPLAHVETECFIVSAFWSMTPLVNPKLIPDLANITCLCMEYQE